MDRLLFNQRNKGEAIHSEHIGLATGEPGFETPEIERVGEYKIMTNEGTEISSEFTETQQQLKDICAEIAEELVEKNRKYGNSALEPKRCFSKAPADEQIKVRLDDKLSRIESGQNDDDEDVLLDLIGYLVLLMVHRRNNV